MILFSDFPHKNIKINLTRYKTKEGIINIESKFESIYFDEMM